MAKQQDPTEEVTAVLAGFRKAFKEQDVDKIMAAYSDDYSNPEGTDKSGLRGFFEGLAEQGALQNTTVGMEECETVVQEDSATAGLVTYSSPNSETRYQYKLKREADGAWRVVSSGQVFRTTAGNIFKTEIVERDAMILVGVTQSSDSKITEIDGNFSHAWTRLMPDKELTGGIKSVKNPDVRYGLEVYPPDYPETNQFTYMAAVEVADLDEIPLQLSAKRIPASKFVAVTIEGWEDHVKAIRYLYDGWLRDNRSEYEVAYPFDFEQYEPEETKFFVPIKKK